MNFIRFFIAYPALVLSFCITMACSENVEQKNTSQKHSLSTLQESFDEIEIIGNINASISHSANPSIDILSSQDNSNIVKTKLENNKLTIYTDPNHPKKSQNISIKILVDTISMLTTNGNTNVKCSHLNLDKLAIKNQGSGSIILNGKIDILNIESTGAFRLRGHQLKVKSLTVESNGVNNIKAQVSDNINIHSNGFNKILYVGSPKVNSKISGYNVVRTITRNSNG